MHWKEPFAWTMLFAYIFFACGSVALYYMHMDRYPIQRSNRSFVLLCCTVAGSAVALTVPGEDINPEGLTCRVHYALFGVMLPLFFLPALMNYLRYVVKCESQALISSLANAASSGRVQRSHTMDQLPTPHHLSFSGHIDQSKSIQDHLLMIQKRTTTRTLLQVSGVFVALFVLARAMINYSVRYARNPAACAKQHFAASMSTTWPRLMAFSHVCNSGNSFGVGADYCETIPGGLIMDTVFVLLFYLSIAALVVYTRMNGYNDDYGVSTDYQYALAGVAPFILIFFLDRWEAADMGFAHHDAEHLQHEKLQADYMTLFGFAVGIFFLITRPALQAMIGARVKMLEENEHRLELILASSAYDVFVDHLRREFCSELILFWRQVKGIVLCYPVSHVFENPYPRPFSPQVAFVKLSNEGSLPFLIAEDMWMNFISDDAPFQINIPHSMRQTIEEVLQNARADESDVAWTLFDEAQKEVYQLMERDCLPRFIVSPEWRAFIAGEHAAQRCVIACVMFWRRVDC